MRPHVIEAEEAIVLRALEAVEPLHVSVAERSPRAGMKDLGYAFRVVLCRLTTHKPQSPLLPYTTVDGSVTAFAETQAAPSVEAATRLEHTRTVGSVTACRRQTTAHGNPDVKNPKGTSVHRMAHTRTPRGGGNHAVKFEKLARAIATDGHACNILSLCSAEDFTGSMTGCQLKTTSGHSDVLR